MVYIPEFNPGRSSVAVQQQSPSIESARKRIAARQNTIPAGARVFIPEFAPARTSQAVQEQIIPVMRPEPRRESTVTESAPNRSFSTADGTTYAPVQTTPASPGPVQETPVAPEQAPAEPEPTPYNVYDDPVYQQALQDAQSQFNLDRIGALASTQYQQRPIERQIEQRPEVAEEARRRLAGNYARRGMAGGRAGVLSRAEAQTNAREIALRTGLRQQISELDRQFTSQFGAEGTDWLGTRRGYEAQQSALERALQNRLAGLTTVG